MRDETPRSGIILVAIVLIGVLLSACQGAASGLDAGAQVVEAAQPDAASQPQEA